MTVRLLPKQGLRKKEKSEEIWIKQRKFESQEANDLFLYGKEGSEIETKGTISPISSISLSMLLLNMNRSYESPTSSPPTPPSPLPVSFAPGNRKYSFSVSSSPSPPFSPEPSSRDSAEPPEKLPLLEEHLHDATTNVPAAVFSLDRQSSQELEPKSTCLKDL